MALVTVHAAYTIYTITKKTQYNVRSSNTPIYISNYSIKINAAKAICNTMNSNSAIALPHGSRTRSNDYFGDAVFLSALVQQPPLIIVCLVSVLCFSHKQWPIKNILIHSKYSLITSIVHIRWQHQLIYSLDSSTFSYPETHQSFFSHTRWQHLFNHSLDSSTFS